MLGYHWYRVRARCVPGLAPGCSVHGRPASAAASRAGEARDLLAWIDTSARTMPGVDTIRWCGSSGFLVGGEAACRAAATGGAAVGAVQVLGVSRIALILGSGQKQSIVRHRWLATLRSGRAGWARRAWGRVG